MFTEKQLAIPSVWIIR